MEAERTGGSSLGVYIVLVQLSVKTPGMLHMGSLVILGIVHKNLDKKSRSIGGGIISISICVLIIGIGLII